MGSRFAAGPSTIVGQSAIGLLSPKLRSIPTQVPAPVKIANVSVCNIRPKLSVLMVISLVGREGLGFLLCYCTLHCDHTYQVIGASMLRREFCCTGAEEIPRMPQHRTFQIDAGPLVDVGTNTLDCSCGWPTTTASKF